MTKPEWLPGLIELNDYGGNWREYIEVVYQFFVEQFVDNQPLYKGMTVAFKRHPEEDNKVYTFGHCTSSDEKIIADRVPDLRRCERIRWIRPIIENCHDPAIKIWKNKRKRETRVLFWLEEMDFVVILTERKGYYILWTTYMTDRPHTREKFRKEYEAYISRNS